MISLKSSREIELMKASAAILRKVFVGVKPAVRPGVTTGELDRMAEEIIVGAGGKPAFKGYRGFSGTACISVNEEVVHGVPGDRVLKEGDIISVDCGVDLKGYFSDAARTWAVGKISPEAEHLVASARAAFMAGFKACKQGARIGDVSYAIQESIEASGYGIVRDFVGHGIGRAVHEDPQVPNYGKAGRGPKIETGLCLAIEPMLTAGSHAVEVLADGWTVATQDRKLSSHYEDSIAVTEAGVINMTGPEEIEEA